MTKAAVIVLADTETHGDLARVVNAMMTAKEFAEAGDDVELMFDGAGTQWLGVLADPDHKSHRLFQQVHDVISGACASAPADSTRKPGSVAPTCLSWGVQGSPQRPTARGRGTRGPHLLTPSAQPLSRENG
jgi:hypothetical protein